MEKPTGMEWELLIAEARAVEATIVEAETFQHLYDSGSQPIRVTASDGQTWVVKGAAGERQLVNEQIVGALGRALGAPVPEIGFVRVSDELIESDATLRSPPEGFEKFRSGVWHGSVFVDGYTERKLWEHAAETENTPGFALLAFLYGWCLCEQDHQFLYRKAPPPYVISHDHGHFFRDGPDWTIESLAGAPIAAPDQKIVSNCRLSRTALENAQGALLTIDAVTAIAKAVAAPREEWGISTGERVAMAQYLFNRYTSLRAYEIE